MVHCTHVHMQCTYLGNCMRRVHRDCVPRGVSVSHAQIIVVKLGEVQIGQDQLLLDKSPHHSIRMCEAEMR